MLPTACPILLKVMANKVKLKKINPFGHSFPCGWCHKKTAEVNAKITAQENKNRSTGKQPLRFHW
jgi:hypothetical protein